MQYAVQQISPVETHLAYWLHYVGCRLFHELRLKALEFGVTAAESVLLRKVHEHEDGAMASRLGLQLGLSRGKFRLEGLNLLRCRAQVGETAIDLTGHPEKIMRHSPNPFVGS